MVASNQTIILCGSIPQNFYGIIQLFHRYVHTYILQNSRVLETLEDSIIHV